ncbi:hypothetical protein CEW83_10905 [Parazoarcus communis]|uniref:Uncharacterized protein n=1 Tax=Parazoarcus communis TaxID=41977 RepID=A0A2U8GPX1_9RHOO|nr:hypothetical protein [Parazoarcus communis]AWI75661.1 hypothetical protein CEW83_10905 [Parazoarcus communis]
MKPDILLVIDADGLEAWRHERGRLEPCAQFRTGGDEAVVAFRSWLETQVHRGRFAILIDLAEERCVLEHLPRANRSDRKAMILRKTRQHFPGTDFTTSEHHGRHDNNPALDTFLLCALTRPALFEPWFKALEQTLAIVTRIDTPPRLLEHWNRGSPFGKDTCLLLSLTAAGMRQTLLRQGRMSFTRIAPARAGSLAECVPIYASELSQTRAYLSGQRLIADNVALKTLFLAHPADRDILSGIGAQDKRIDLQFIDIPAQAQPRQPRGATSGSDTRPFLLQGLVDKPPPIHYPAATLTSEFATARLRRRLLGIAGSAALAMLLAAGAMLLDARDLARQTAPLEAERLALQQQADDVNRQRPALPAPMAVTLDWLDELEHIRSRAIPDDHVMRQVSAMLEATPALQLERLSWHAADAAPDRRGAVAGPAEIAVEIDASLEPDTTFADDSPMEQTQRLIDDWQRSFHLQIEARHLPSLASSADELARDLPRPSRLSLRFMLPPAQSALGEP